MAMIVPGWYEWVLIAASLGVFILMIRFIASFFSFGRNTTRRRGLKFPILIAILVGAVLAPLLGTRRHTSQLTHRDFGENDGLASTVVEVKHTRTNPDPSLEALWDKLTRSKINLDRYATAPVAEPTAERKDEIATAEVNKDAATESSSLDESKLPQWVVTPPKRVGQVLRESVASDPFVTEDECRRQLEQELLPHSVARHIGYLASAKAGHAVTIDDPLAMGIGLDFIFGEICRDEHTTTVDTSVGEMKKVHVLLEYDPAVDEQLLEAWLRRERQSRFASVGKVAALSLSGLAAIYGMLRFDTWSKGYYSGRLLVGGTLAIIGLAVLLL